MNKDQKLFAFKLASNKQAQQDTEAQKDAQKWQARDSIATAGCTGPFARAGRLGGGTDNGIYC